MLRYSILILTAVVTTTAAHAQSDLDPMRRQAWVWRDAGQHHLWTIDDSDTTSQCQLQIRSLHPTTWTPQSVVGAGGLPFHRLGAMLGVREVSAPAGVERWEMLVSGLQYTFDSAPFPATRNGVLCWMGIELSGGAYTFTTLNVASYGDVDLLNGHFDEGGTFLIDGRSRSVLHSDWTPQLGSTSLPAATSWDLVAVDSQVGGWLMAPNSCALGAVPNEPNTHSDEAFALATTAQPTEYYKFSKAEDGTWSVSHHEEFPVLPAGLIVREALTVGGTEALEVFAPTSYGSSVTLTLEDDQGNPLLDSHSIGTGSWQSLPVVSELNARPGRRHDLSVDGEAGIQNWVIPTVRRGDSVSWRSGFELGHAYITPSAAAGQMLRSGVYVDSDLPVNEPVTVLAIMGLRDAQGVDPIVDFAGHDILDIANTAQVSIVTLAVGAPAGRLGSSCGMKLDIPSGLGEQVVLFQYAFLFSDDTMAFSEIVGGTTL